MANPKRDDDPTSTQLPTSQIANAPISSVKLDGPKTYLVWSRQCTVALKARRLFGYVAGTKKQPSDDDPTYEQWDKQNSLTMSLLFNSMDPSLVGSYILYDTAAQIWSAIKQTYSQSNNYAEILAIHQKLLALKQGELTVVTYINAITSEWQKLDFCDPFTTSFAADNIRFKARTDRERLYKFLDGLNPEFDQTRSQILGRSPLPTLEEAFAFVQHESSRREAMLHTPSTEVAAKSDTPANKGNTHGKRPWCDHCKKLGHIREKCFKLVGYPTDSKRPMGNNTTRKEPSGPKANTTEAVNSHGLSLEDIQAVKRLLTAHSASSSTSEPAGFYSTL